MSKYFKYVSTGNHGSRVVGIRPDNYSSRLSQIAEMAAIAKTDYPHLTDADIHTVAYDGDRWKRQTGIEWSVDASFPIPEGYIEISRLEYVFAGN